jgi:hypothetical protein
LGSTAGASLTYGICQSLGFGEPFFEGAASTGALPGGFGETPFTASASFVLATPGTYQVGFCTQQNDGTFDLIGETNGWVMVTN